MKKTNKKSATKKVAKKVVKMAKKAPAKISKKSAKKSPARIEKMEDRVRLVESDYGMKAKTVIKDSGTFIRIWPDENNENKMLRLHVFQNGHWNIQYKGQEGTNMVIAKGKIS